MIFAISTAISHIITKPRTFTLLIVVRWKDEIRIYFNILATKMLPKGHYQLFVCKIWDIWTFWMISNPFQMSLSETPWSFKINLVSLINFRGLLFHKQIIGWELLWWWDENICFTFSYLSSVKKRKNSYWIGRIQPINSWTGKRFAVLLSKYHTIITL